MREPTGALVAAGLVVAGNGIFTSSTPRHPPGSSLFEVAGAGSRGRLPRHHGRKRLFGSAATSMAASPVHSSANAAKLPQHWPFGLSHVVAHYDNDTWTEESWTRECDKSEALANYSGWHESLLRLFAASELHYKWALYERDPLPAWTSGRATLLGDAAHPMLPYLGQGAAQAIEDGCVLATALSELPNELGAALRLYERSRLARTTQVLLGARARGAGDQTPSRWVAMKRNALIALRSRFGSDRTGRNFAWLYDYDAGSRDALVQAANPARR
jgi:2-polyprenyl-6-methoxyphenol hydroxylase-like FAD-dependent oxidoreductase